MYTSRLELEFLEIIVFAKSRQRKWLPMISEVGSALNTDEIEENSESDDDNNDIRRESSLIIYFISSAVHTISLSNT